MNAFTKIALAAAVAGTCFAQSAVLQDPKFYKVEFTVKELDGAKIINTRKYGMNIGSEQGRNSIRAGAKVPVHNGNSPVTSTSFTYMDVGVNIDCSLIKELTSGLVLSITTDITNTAASPEGTGLPQITRMNRWNATVLVAPKKPTVVFSAEDPATGHQMQLEVMATPIL